MSDTTQDPIEELVRGLEARDIPLAWVVRWSADGEPVAAAWQASRDSNAMCAFLDRFGATVSPMWRDPPGPPSRPLNRQREPKLWEIRAQSLADRADRIRREFSGRLPTLRELLDGFGGGA